MNDLERNVIRETENGFSALNIQDHLLDGRNVYLNSEVNGETALALLQQFMYLENENNEGAINFFINSPGGSVADGMIVYDFIRMMKSKVRTICIGRASSMGAILFLASDNRLMFPHAEIMIHDASFANANFSGLKPDEIEEKTKDLVKTCKMLRDLISKRTGRSVDEVTEKMKKDSYFEVDEALEFGLATQKVTTAKEMMINLDEFE